MAFLVDGMIMVRDVLLVFGGVSSVVVVLFGGNLRGSRRRDVFTVVRTNEFEGHSYGSRTYNVQYYEHGRKEYVRT